MDNDRLNMLTEYAVEAHILAIQKDYLEEGLKDLSLEQLKKMKEGVTKGLKKIEDEVEKKGIRVGLLKSKAKQSAKKYQGMIKKFENQKVDPSKAGKELSKAVSKDAIGAIKDSLKSFNYLSTGEKIIYAFVALLVIIFISQFILIILAVTIQDPDVVLFALVVIVAPMVEEGAKAWFAANGMPWVGTGIVFGLEFVKYVIGILAAGGSLGKTLLLRAITLLMHFTTQAIQVKGAESDWVKSAYVVSVLIHASFNFFAIVMNEDINAWVMS